MLSRARNCRQLLFPVKPPPLLSIHTPCPGAAFFLFGTSSSVLVVGLIEGLWLRDATFFRPIVGGILLSCNLQLLHIFCWVAIGFPDHARRFLGSLPETNMEIAVRSKASVSCSSLQMMQSFSTCWDSLVPVDQNAGFIVMVTAHHHGTFYPLNAVPFERQTDVSVVNNHLSSPLDGPTLSFSSLLNATFPDNINNFCPVESGATVSPADYQLGTPNQCCSVNPSPENPGGRIQASARECDGMDHGASGQKEEQTFQSHSTI